MKNSDNHLESLRIKQSKANQIFQPVFFRLHNQAAKKEFNALIHQPGIIVVDYIFDQINELIKCKNPGRKFSASELNEQMKGHLGDTDPDDYGVWIFYPWSSRLVHILDEEEFVEVRTSRNQYKITKEERDILARKKVGIIGLSVGQSVSVTMAMERICGELRLADFDILELTNLNRIRTGLHNLGLPKVYSVAREIAELDPFIKVVCFPEGLSDANMDEFFTLNGKLDLLIEESDGFDIKIMSRYKARELGIPVLMEGSDRCVVDVERFDLEPKRSILHGLVDHLDIETLKHLKTNEQKIPYMLDILGLETSSTRLKASMLEIDQTINTWPQLASSVTMGGGITADVARRMMLNYYTESGRYHVDIEELISNKKQVPAEKTPPAVIIAVDFKKQSQAFHPETEKEQIPLSREEAEILVLAGCQAPSGGNSQPWRWSYINNTLLLFNGFDGNPTLLGYDNLPSYIALGAAIENVVLRAEEMKLSARCTLFPDAGLKDLVAAFRFFKSSRESSRPERIKAIDLRLTNRKLGERKPIENQILQRLESAAAEVEGARLQFFTSAEELDTIGNILGELEKIRLLEKTGHRDFVEEIRWTKEENDQKRDGVDLRTLDITNVERAGLKMSKDEKVMTLINTWKGGGAFKKLTKKSIDAAGAVGVILMNGKSHAHYVNAGRALQRIWLETTSAGIAFQPMSASVFVYARLMQGHGEGIGKEGRLKLQNLRPMFEKTFSVPEGFTEMFIFRLSRASEPEVKSLRKPLDELFSYF